MYAVKGPSTSARKLRQKKPSGDGGIQKVSD